MNKYKDVFWEKVDKHFIKLCYEGSVRRLAGITYRHGYLIRSIPEGYKGTTSDYAKAIIDELYCRQKLDEIEELKKIPHMRVRSSQ